MNDFHPVQIPQNDLTAQPKGRLALFDNDLLFDPRGHLSEPGMAALQDGRLDELGSLDVAEHLTFCDYCLARYTALLEAIPEKLQNPMRDLIPQVQNLMRLRSFRILTNRYVSTVAAAVLGFVMWQFISGGLYAAPAAPAAPTPYTSISQMVNGALTSLSDGIGAILSGMQATAQNGFDQLAGRSAADKNNGG